VMSSCSSHNNNSSSSHSNHNRNRNRNRNLAGGGRAALLSGHHGSLLQHWVCSPCSHDAFQL
jgi:hypothetical protein